MGFGTTAADVARDVAPTGTAIDVVVVALDVAVAAVVLLVNRGGPLDRTQLHGIKLLARNLLFKELLEAEVGLQGLARDWYGAASHQFFPVTMGRQVSHQSVTQTDGQN